MKVVFHYAEGYYNPHIIKVIDKLISGVDVMTRNDIISSATESFRPSPRARARSRSDAGTGTPHGSPTPGRGARAKAIVSSIDLDSEDVANDHQPAHVQGSCLYQIALPDGMIGKRYGVLYRRLSKEGIIPLGLLRGTGAPTQIAPYVYTNPKYDTTLNAADRVFILSAKPIPDEADCCEVPPTTLAFDAWSLGLICLFQPLCMFHRTQLYRPTVVRDQSPVALPANNRFSTPTFPLP